VLGIECDGAAYHSSVVARDRDRLRQEVLEGLGWRLHRIWGPSWYRERQAELARLERSIEMAINGGPQPTQVSRPADVVTPLVLEVEEELAPWAELYQPFVPDVGLLPVSLDDNSCLPELRNALRQVVTALAPVHADLCVQAIREAWGVDRMGSRRRQRVEEALDSLVRQGKLDVDRHGFYWVAGEYNAVVRGADPDDPESIRKPQLVSPDELKLAISNLVQDARSIEEEDLLRRVARIFGWARTGADIKALLRRCCSELVADGSLRKTDEAGNGVLQAGNGS
jgi:hypothetical protein